MALETVINELKVERWFKIYIHTTWYATKSLYAEMLEDCQRESEEFELYGVII